METQVLNEGACIRVVNDKASLLVCKSHIKTIATYKNEGVSIDMGEGPLQGIYIRHADVTVPAGLADAIALRDAITMMLDDTSGKLSDLKDSIDALVESQKAQTASMLTILSQIKDALYGVNNSYSQPLRVDETTANIVYNGYAQSQAGAPAGGPDTNDPVWAIERITRNGDQITYEWADGTRDFRYSWNGRYALNYLPLIV